MKPEAGKAYWTKSGLLTTKLRRLDNAGSVLKWTADVGGMSCWWLEDGSYATDGSHANDLAHEEDHPSDCQASEVVRTFVGDPSPQWVKDQMQTMEKRQTIKVAVVPKTPHAGVKEESPKPECTLDLISVKLTEMVVMCDQALEFDPLQEPSS